MRVVLLACAAICGLAWAGDEQTPPAARVLDWIVAPQSDFSVMEWARGRVRTLTEYVVRATSPDVEAGSRRLWILNLATGAKCLLSSEPGVHEPRWGSAGYIVFLADADTNADGRIDFNDEQLVRVMSQNGGPARTVGRGRSAAWSPDGKVLAVVSQGKVNVIDVQGTAIALGSNAAVGQILITDNRNPDRASLVWAMDARDGKITRLDSEPTRKYLWIGALTRDGKRAVFANAQRSDLFVGDPATPADAINVTQDEYLDFDPSWSPDEKRLVYVSTNPADDQRCR